MTEEGRRLEEARQPETPWKKWGPYLSERQWGTVREDYSDTGDAWDYFSHDQARSRAYRWGEDGLAGISDDRQRPLLRARPLERRGSDRQGAALRPHQRRGQPRRGRQGVLLLPRQHADALVHEVPLQVSAARPIRTTSSSTTNRRRGRHELEYELLDTGVFDDDRYFDVFVEYAKAAPEDILVRLTVANRGPEAATLHVLPTLWFRNTWSWGGEAPQARAAAAARARAASASSAPRTPSWASATSTARATAPLLFTENETNTERVFGKPNASPWVKDAINNYVVHGKTDAVNPAQTGTKVAAHYQLTRRAGQSAEIRLRLSADDPPALAPGPFGPDFDAIVRGAAAGGRRVLRRRSPRPASIGDAALVMRQALAGMLWSKQFYYYDVGALAHGARRRSLRAARQLGSATPQWSHMVNADVISMPDKWEYPWYAAWDLAFHTIALDLVDPDFAKQQLLLMLEQQYLHPNGQIPAYEWNFGDVNPPVHAWASLVRLQP